jgi:hypothetical protein
MQTAKIVGAGLCALLTVGTLFNLLGEMPKLQAAGGNSVGIGLRVLAVLAFAALAVWLWRSATARKTPRP